MASTLKVVPKLSADELRSCSRPDAMCILPVGTKNGHQRDVQDVHPSRWDVHLIEVKNITFKNIVMIHDQRNN